MSLEPAKKQQGMILGALIGALIGAGGAYLLMTAPKAIEEGKEPAPITATDVIGLTGAAAVLVRKLDDFRRKT